MLPMQGSQVQSLVRELRSHITCSATKKNKILFTKLKKKKKEGLGQNMDLWISKKKVHLVKAMVFPVVMYGCESWKVKKAER